MQTAEKVMSNIIPTTQIAATTGTLAWIEALYQSGAVTFGPEGEIAINPEVREVIRAMHAVLAGGEVRIEIVQDGGSKCADLERRFELAMDQAIAANLHRNPGDAAESPLVP